ncbi:MAG: YDG domain-containing protein, partial [Polaromonas sp.]|uniref:YDG domain-containing protein n=1 Tax=Polaromonas sp. TaxID=1869339 RepID=UPI0027365EBB
AGGNVQLDGAVNSTGGARALSVTAGTGDVTLSGAIGAASALSALTVNANAMAVNNHVVRTASLAATLTGGTSALVLGNAGNQITTLNTITTPGGFTLNNGNNSVTVAGNITTTNNAVLIDAGTGGYTQNANIDVVAGTGAISVIADTVAINTTNTGNNAFSTSGTLTLKPKTAGQAMSLAGAAAFDLTALEMARFATGVAGPIIIGDTASTGVLTIGAPVSLAGKTLTLNAGSMTDTGTQTLTATNVTLNANGQIGTGSANGIDIAAINLSVNTTGNANAFVRTGAVNLGVGTGGSNLGSGTLDLTATGAVTQTATTGNVTAGTLQVKTLVNAGAAITLTNSGNNVGAVNVQSRNLADAVNAGGAIQYTDTNGFDVAAVATTGNATLSAGGAVTQSGAISASGLALTGTGGNHTLRHTGNAVTTLAANTGSIDYSQAGALTVGTVAGVVGVTTAVAAKIETTGAASDLTLANAVTSNGTGDAIVLKAGSSNAAGTSTGGQFIMGIGGSIAASAGRYLVYSGNPATTTEGVTGYNKRYNTSSSFTPGGSANMFLYRIAPTLTINTDNATRVYGDVNPAFTGPTTGLIDGDTDASVGVFRSTSAVFNTPVAAGPIAITPGATNNENYALVLNNGLLTITRRGITGVTGIVAFDKRVDGNTSAALNSGAAGFSNMVMGDALNVATATGNFGSNAVGSNKTVFISGITLGGDSSDNYTLLDSTARTTASIRDLSSFTGALFPVPSLLPVLPKAFATSGLTVAAANALLENAPTASGGSRAQFTMLREPAGGEEGSASVTVTSTQDGSGSGFRFSLPADFLGGGGPLQATTSTGGPLPEWLRFDPNSRSFVASGAPTGALPMQIRISVGDRAVVLTISEAQVGGPSRGVLVEHRDPVPANSPG